MKKFHGVKFFAVSFDPQSFLTVDSYNMEEHLESSEHLVYYQYQESQVSLAVVVNRTFMSGGIDLHAHLFIDCCRTSCILFLHVNFSWLVLTAKLF